jgi:hypothetical protein
LLPVMANAAQETPRNGLQILTDAAAVLRALPDRPCGRRPVDTT